MPVPRHCALPGLVVGNWSDTAPTAQTEPEASLVEAFLQRQLLVASRLLTAVPTAAFGVTVSTVNAFVQSTLALVNGAALATKVVEQTTIGQPQLIKTAAADVGTEPSIRVISRIPSIATSINNGRRLIANALSPERRAAQATAPAAKVAATNVAKKPKSTATTVHKAAAGASSAAAAKLQRHRSGSDWG